MHIVHRLLFTFAPELILSANTKTAPPRPKAKELTMFKVLSPATGFFALALIAATPAHAIDCDGNFQVQPDGRLVATPYCEDTYLARVAREHGMRVSGAAIRGNPSVKAKACRFVGDDNRVRDTCSQYRPELRDWRR